MQTLRTVFHLTVACCVCAVTLSGCTPKNEQVDLFVWDQLDADRQVDQVEYKGKTNLYAFLDEMKRYPWLEQGKLGAEIGNISATLSVTDYLTDRTLFISSGYDEDLCLFVGNIVPSKEPKDEITQRFVAVYQIDSMPVIENLVTFFFERNYAGLDALLGFYEPFLEGPDEIDWNEYLAIKQKYLKQS